LSTASSFLEMTFCGSTVAADRLMLQIICVPMYPSADELGAYEWK
jgi:hypothetical protein